MTEKNSNDTGFARRGDLGDYKEALDYLYSQLPMFSRVGGAAYKPGLQTSEQLDEWFGHPHRRFKSIHVGGTNGKGSCSHTIAAMLQAEGYKVGLYTSPHLVDFRERIRVNGEMIPKEAVVDFTRRWKDSDYHGHPSFFELTMMMAFDWFARAEVDYAVIEVGMGGRLDSTNIITPEACIITNISPDHTQFLGDTLEKIAAEKAGIFKRDIPAVVGEAEGGVREVFASTAKHNGTPLVFAEDRHQLLSTERNVEGGWDCNSLLVGRFHAALSGDYQLKNINTVLSAVAMLREEGIAISDESVRRGFEEVESLTGLRGRWTILGKSPLCICDTGHNEAGIKSNMHQLNELISKREGARLKMVIGFVADKDVEHILRMLPKEADYYFCNARIPRALPAEKLAEVAEGAGLKGRLIPDVKKAYETALAEADGKDIVYVGGSTFVVADLLSAL